MKRRVLSSIIFVLLLSVLQMAFASEIIGASDLDIVLDLKEEGNVKYLFGFSSNEVKNFFDKVDDISGTGVDLTVSEDRKEATLGNNKVYVWWKVLSSEPFTVKLSISNFRRIGGAAETGIGEFPASISFVDKEGEETTLNSEGLSAEGILYKRKDTSVYGDCDSIPLDIFAKGIGGVVPGDYSGTLVLNLFVGE